MFEGEGSIVGISVERMLEAQRKARELEAKIRKKEEEAEKRGHGLPLSDEIMKCKCAGVSISGLAWTFNYAQV